MRGLILLAILTGSTVSCRPGGGGGGPGYPATPAEVVGAYHDALQHGLTRQAYEFLGPDWRAAVPYDQFAADFSALRVSDYRALATVEATDRLAKVRVRVRAIPAGAAPRYYDNTLTLLRDPATRRWVVSLADSREIREEDFRE